VGMEREIHKTAKEVVVDVTIMEDSPVNADAPTNMEQQLIDRLKADGLIQDDDFTIRLDKSVLTVNDKVVSAEPYAHILKPGMKLEIKVGKWTNALR